MMALLVGHIYNPFEGDKSCERGGRSTNKNKLRNYRGGFKVRRTPVL